MGFIAVGKESKGVVRLQDVYPSKTLSGGWAGACTWKTGVDKDEKRGKSIQASLISKGYLKAKDGKYDLKGAMFCSGIFKRPRWQEPSPTVLTNFHNPRYFLHPLENRPFSLRECARLQGFPDTFLFTGCDSKVDLKSGYRLVGNAVPPPLSRLFAAATLHFLVQKSNSLQNTWLEPKHIYTVPVLCGRLW